MSWATYVSQEATGLSQKELAVKAGVSASIVSRWRSGEVTPSAENIVALARGMGWRPLDALVAVGLITAKEARQRTVTQPSWDGIPDDKLIELVVFRLEEAKELRSHAGSPANTVPPEKGAPGSEEEKALEVGSVTAQTITTLTEDGTTETVEGEETA